jgi:hypothetical protein
VTCTVTALRNLTAKVDCNNGRYAHGLTAGDVFATLDIAVLLKPVGDQVEMQIAAMDAAGNSTMKAQGLVPVVSTAPRWVAVPE